MADASFNLDSFLPYLLNQAAEATSHSFHVLYRDRYGMTRTQWRVLANLGRFGAMTARDICAISHVEKTKVSRAVSALEREGLLTRVPPRRNPVADARGPRDLCQARTTGTKLRP
jgi:DNA-binding MarR family transcriptional regulator